MLTALTSLFGDEIRVYDKPRIAEIQFSGFPGGHGVTSMNLGTRGKPLVITGTLRYAGDSYDDSRANLEEWIAELEALTWADAADYTYHGKTYEQLQFIKIDPIPDGSGKLYHMTGNAVLVNFVAYGHILE